MSKMNNESYRVHSSPPLISKVDEQLKEIQRIRDISNNNLIQKHKIRKLEQELEEYEAQIKSKQLKLKRVIDQNERHKSSIQQKNDMVIKLTKDLEKRDKILELCHNKGGENSEVFFNCSNGHRAFEFKNKQKIPFTIKIERLSPVPFFERSPTESVIEAEIGFHGEPEFEKEIQCKEEEQVTEKKQSNENSPPKELLQKEFDELPIYKEEEAKVDENWEVFFEKHKQKEKLNDTPHQQQEILLKQQKTMEEYNQYYAFYYAQQQLYQNQLAQYYQTLPSSSTTTTTFSSSVTKIPKECQNSVSENVLNIPEIFRSNFGSSECPELAENPMALQFWFDPENSHMTKFFIKLHGDETTYANTSWKENKYFVLIEQLGLNIPTTYMLKHDEMLKKIEKIPVDQTRIWLDVRNFNLIFHLPHSFLSTENLTRVTHFSFGKGREGNKALDSHLLLEFLLNHLGNLEFCFINNDQLWSKSFRQPKVKSGREEMRNLKTLIFFHGNRNFPGNFITTILKLSPNLQSIFNMPLNNVQEMSPTVKSLYFRRDLYNPKDTGVLTFVEHLSFLHGLSQRGNQWNFLQELDCRVFFLNCDSETKDICCEWLSQILMMHAQSLRLVKLEPVSSNAFSLSQATMENLTTFHFNLRRKFDESLLSFFPLGFYPVLFPKLSTVEIVLEFRVKRCGPTPAILFWKHFPSTIFSPGVSFYSVTSLKLQGFNVVGCIKGIAELFPNLQILRLQDELQDVCAVLPSCYSSGFWSGLKQLHLNVNGDTRYLNLDAALLGASEQMCKNLRRQNQQVQEEEIQKLASSSICQLKELEFLKVVLRPAENQEQGRQLPIITQVGALVLSQCNSQLKVQIAFDESVDELEKKRIVSSLSPLQSFSSLFLPIF